MASDDRQSRAVAMSREEVRNFLIEVLRSSSIHDSLFEALKIHRIGASSSHIPSEISSTAFDEAIEFLSNETVRGHDDADVHRKEKFLDCSIQVMECIIDWKVKMREENLSTLHFWDRVIASIFPLVVSSLRELSFHESFYDSGKDGDEFVVVAFLCNVESILRIINEHVHYEPSKMGEKKQRRYIEICATLRYIESILGKITLSLKDLLVNSVHEDLVFVRSASIQPPSPSQQSPSSQSATSCSLMEIMDPILNNIDITIDPFDMYSNSLFRYFVNPRSTESELRDNSNEQIMNLNIGQCFNVLRMNATKLLKTIQLSHSVNDGAEELIFILKAHRKLPSGGCAKVLCCSALFTLLSASCDHTLMPNLSAPWTTSGVFTALATFCVDLIVSDPEPTLHKVALVLLSFTIKSTTSSNVLSSASWVISSLIHRLGALCTGLYRFVAMRCIHRLLVASSSGLLVPHQTASSVEMTGGVRRHNDSLKFYSIMDKSTSNLLHTYIQELNNLVISSKEIDEVYFATCSLRMYVSFCPEGVLLCQMSYMQELLSNIITSATNPALCDQAHAISTMNTLLQTVIIVSNSVSSECMKTAFPKFFVHVSKCRIIANAKLKVSSDCKWQKIDSLYNLWIDILIKQHSFPSTSGQNYEEILHKYETWQRENTKFSI